MISKQLLDHSLFLLKTLGDSLWILPKQAFATEQSVGSWVINRVCNNFLVLCLTCTVCLVGILCNLSTPWSNIDWQYWPWVSGCTNYIRSIVGDEYCLTRQKRLPRETTGCLSAPETLTMRWMFAVQYGLEQGSKMNGFYLKQGQGLKASVANPYPNFHKCFPPPAAPGTQTVSYFVLISSSLETQTDFH